MLVRTSDTFTYTVPDGVAGRCGTLIEAALASCGASTAEPVVVPVPNVSSTTMALVVQYYTKLEELERADATAHARAVWKDAFFQTTPRADLFLAMEAANYLDAASLLDDAAAHVAALISGKTPDEIREALLLPRDTTADEARATAKELAWALQ